MTVMIVYKYVHQDITQILTESKIRFTQASALNDPFDTLPGMSEIKEFVLCMTIEYNGGTRNEDDKAENHAAFVDSAKKCRAYSGKYHVLLSLAKQRDNLLMWCHYANSHQGYVLGFDSGSCFFNPGNGKGKDGLRNVEYSDTRFKCPVDFGELSPEKQEEAMTGTLFTKSRCWEYENEMRILASPKLASSIKILPNDEYCYLYDFPRDAIREVILGFAMPEEKRQEITKIIKEKFSKAILFQAELHEDDFALKIAPIL